METKINWLAIVIAIIAVLCALYLYFSNPYRLSPPVENLDYVVTVDDKGEPIPYDTNGERLTRCKEGECPLFPVDVKLDEIFTDDVTGFLVLRQELSARQGKLPQKSSAESTSTGLSLISSAHAAVYCTDVFHFSGGGSWLLPPGCVLPK